MTRLDRVLDIAVLIAITLGILDSAIGGDWTATFWASLAFFYYLELRFLRRRLRGIVKILEFRP